jgi:hypothetical protein
MTNQKENNPNSIMSQIKNKNSNSAKKKSNVLKNGINNNNNINIPKTDKTDFDQKTVNSLLNVMNKIQIPNF